MTKYICNRCNKVLSSLGHAMRHVRTQYHFPIEQLQDYNERLEKWDNTNKTQIMRK